MRLASVRSGPRLRRTRHGAVVVEFALVAPILVFATLGMTEMTRGFQVKQTLSDAARSGCRLAILPGGNNATVIANINDILTDNGISSGDATITIQVNGTTANCNTAVQDDRVSVKVSIPVNRVSWIPSVFLPSSAIESEQLVMYRQR